MSGRGVGRLVLASGSPRRRDLLGVLGVPFTVAASGVDEVAPARLPPARVAVALALDKARAVAARVGPGRGLVVLGADTIVVIGGRLLGKPTSRGDARAMLRALRGRTHVVVTGVAVVRPAARREWTAAVQSRVTMRAFPDAELEAYLLTGEPDDKAGAYAAQGRGVALLRRVDGSFTNVVGLPLRTTARLLRAAGLPARLDPRARAALGLPPEAARPSAWLPPRRPGRLRAAAATGPARRGPR